MTAKPEITIGGDRDFYEVTIRLPGFDYLSAINRLHEKVPTGYRFFDGEQDMWVNLESNDWRRPSIAVWIAEDLELREDASISIRGWYVNEDAKLDGTHKNVFGMDEMLATSSAVKTLLEFLKQ